VYLQISTGLIEPYGTVKCETTVVTSGAHLSVALDVSLVQMSERPTPRGWVKLFTTKEPRAGCQVVPLCLHHRPSLR